MNAVSWCPALAPASLINPQGALNNLNPRKLVSGGCDHLIKVWTEDNGVWKEEHVLQGHSDWIRDVSWAPAVGLPYFYIASCSQDKTVMIWTFTDNQWKKKVRAASLL